MNLPRLLCSFLLAALLALALPARANAQSAELAELRARLIELYQNGRTDSDNQVKQLREKIAAMEYIAANKPQNAPEPAARLINIDFPGGSLDALIAAINKDAATFNVVGEKGDLALDLPPFSLRNADPTALAMALGELVKQRGYLLQQSNVRTLPGQASVYALRKLASHETPGSGVNFQSFQLGPYLEHQTVDDIVGALRAAWELDPANKPDALRVKYHPPTGILLVSAPPQGINVVHTVLGQLRRSEGPKAKTDSTPAPAKK